MGRSPVLATVMVTVARPAFSSISPSWGMISPGIMRHLLRHEESEARSSGQSPDSARHQSICLPRDEETAGDAGEMKRRRRERKARGIESPAATRRFEAVGVA